MKFVSAVFLLFVALVCIIYFLTPKKWRWGVLLGASYIFYWLNSRYLFAVILGMSVVTFLVGIVIDRKSKRDSAYLKERKGELSSAEKKAYKLKVTRSKRRVLAVGILLDLGVLLFFKYYNFFAENICSILRAANIDAEPRYLSLILPLGISFYTLQAIAYMVDIYRGKYEADRKFFHFALFMSFFPQIVQGPIARHDKLAAQLYEGHSFDFKRVKYGCQLILWGFMKKLILADRLGILVDQIFDHHTQYQGFVLLIGAMGYGLQVYADFAAGMDIARGVSQILGIELELNFKQPYFAKSIEEFWRRWHITLGAWMRDYIFYPLSLSKAFGNMGKRVRKIFGNYIGKKLPSFLAMFIVYLLVGFWHGSSWKYVAYGIWNGVIITSGILLAPVYAKGISVFRIDAESYSWKLFQMARTFFLCSVGRFFSRADSCMTAFSMIKNSFTKYNPWVLFDDTLLTLGLDWKDMAVLIAMILVLLLVDIAHERGVRIRESIASQGFVFRWLVYWLAFFMVIIFGMYGPSYDSSSFIYQQF